MVFWALGIMWTQILENLSGKVEAVKNIWSCVSYHNRIDEKKKTLKRKLEALSSVEDDFNKILEAAESHSGKKRKKEVETWLWNVRREKIDFKQAIEQQIGDTKYLLGPWWENRLEKHICEVEELYDRGKSFDGLLLNEQHQTGGEALLTMTLVGRSANEGVFSRIWECLMNNVVLRIGVHGAEGVGKTEIMMHIHNQLLESASFDHVYWVPISEQFSIHELQSNIAKTVGVDLLDEEDVRKRAANLFKGISRKKKCVIFLDGLCSYFQQDEVGIPTKVNGCKLIITSRLLRVCKRMDCQEIIKIEPLPGGEAEKLFKDKLGLSNPLAPEIEAIAKVLIKGCSGSPYKIITVAERMRGVDDITEWRNTLHELGIS